MGIVFFPHFGLSQYTDKIPSVIICIGIYRIATNTKETQLELYVPFISIAASATKPKTANTVAPDLSHIGNSI